MFIVRKRMGLRMHNFNLTTIPNIFSDLMNLIGPNIIFGLTQRRKFTMNFLKNVMYQFFRL